MKLKLFFFELEASSFAPKRELRWTQPLFKNGNNGSSTASKGKQRQAFAIIMLLLVLTGCSVEKEGAGVSAQEDLAKCLKGKGVVFYGSDRCENCQRQKSLFGEAFAIIDYKNCDFSASECEKKGIKVYPVWSLENRVVLGTQSLKQLAEFANCSYPPGDEK